MTRCMIADDSLFQRRIMGKILTQMGWEVVAEAANGKEAVERYSDSRPDLVFMDLVMPEMEGIEAIEKILAMDEKARIIVISSMGYDEIVNKAISLGAKQFITKPMSINAVAVIKSVLEERV